jgi:hypothetical protein
MLSVVYAECRGLNIVVLSVVCAECHGLNIVLLSLVCAECCVVLYGQALVSPLNVRLG